MIDNDPMEGPWYSFTETWANNFTVSVVEIDDETTGHKTIHKVGPADLKRGLEVLAQKYPHHFAEVLGEADASTADLLMQCVCFGEEKYA